MAVAVVAVDIPDTGVVEKGELKVWNGRCPQRELRSTLATRLMSDLIRYRTYFAQKTSAVKWKTNSDKQAKTSQF